MIFQVHYEKTVCGTVEVEAETEEEARRQWFNDPTFTLFAQEEMVDWDIRYIS